MVVLLLVSVIGTGAQGTDINRVDYEFWSALSWGEKMAYVDGVIGGTYALALIYMGENPGLGGPDLFGYAVLYVQNTELVELVDAVYREKRFRVAPVAAILINYKKWKEYLGR